MAAQGLTLVRFSQIAKRGCSSEAAKGLIALAEADPVAAGNTLKTALSAEQRAAFQQAFGSPGTIHQIKTNAPPPAKSAPSASALFTVAVAAGVPFVGFGFLDNFIMLALSTMAAAGLGNIVSDIAGLGFADVIEAQARKLKWCSEPPLTILQRSMYSTRACKVGGSVIGITIGGLLGLMPLLWIANPDMPPKPQAIA